MPQQPAPGAGRLDRRTLIGAGISIPAALWLAACGGDDSGSGSGGSGGSGLPSGVFIQPRFPRDVLVPGSVRMPISFQDGDVLLADGPATITGRVVADDGTTTVADGLSASRVQLDADTAQFWIVRADIAQPGIYGLVVDGIDEPMAFQVLEPSQVGVPVPGKPLPPFDTPTLDDPGLVDPICTRAAGTCPLHSITLTEALTLGKPVAYLVSTPAHCSYGVCGPVLDLLLDAHEEYGDRVTMVHADVYTDDTATITAPAVLYYAMSWEPSLYVTDASGTLVDRLDITYTADELREVLTRAGA